MIMWPCARACFRGTKCGFLEPQISEILVAKNAAGEHQSSWNTERRLQSVLEEFHNSKLMTSKFALDAEKTKSILNLITGTVSAP